MSDVSAAEEREAERGPWPFAAGEMARRVRLFPWGETPLGAIEAWPQSLRVATDLMLASPMVATLVCGPARILIYNDAAARLYGPHHPHALGRPLPETFPEGWRTVAPLYERVFAGESVQVVGQPLDTRGDASWARDVFDAGLAPVRDEGGSVVGAFMTGFEVSERLRAQDALRESEERQAFLLRLSDALRVLADPVDVKATACRLLGEHLAVDRTAYAEFSPDGRRVATDGGWSRPGVSPVAGSHDVRDDEAFVAVLRRGETAVVHDTLDEGPRPSSPHGSMWDGLGIRAAIAAPLVEGARLVAALDVHSLPPRRWTAAEVALVTDVGERTWAAIQRAQAQAALRASEARLAAAFESVPAGVAITGADGRAVISNKEYRRFLPTGIIPSRDPARLARWRAWSPDGEPIQPSDFPGARAMRGERVMPGQAMLYLDDEGREVWTSVATVPLLDDADRVTGQVTVITDVDGLTRKTEALRESEERFRQFATASRDALWIRNAATLAMEFVSPAVEPIYGVAPERMVGPIERWVELILPEDRATALAHVEQAREGRAVVHEFRVRRPSDGTVRWIRDTDFPLLDERGQVQRIGGIAQDVTEAKRSTEHQAILLAELQHRVRNTLAVIRSIARRTAASSETIEDYALELDGRLNAFARVQSAVARNPLAGIDLEYLIADELMLNAAKDGRQVRLEGPPIRLHAKAAETLGLAVHELATNAAKYGALSVPGGRVRVTWRHEAQLDPPQLHLTWKESGVRPATLTPERQGFGTSLLLRTVAYELKAEVRLEIEADGLRYSMLLPLTDKVVVRDDP